MAEEALFKVPTDVIKPIIEAKVAAAMVEALGNQDWLIRNAIGAVLNQKVNDNGTKCESYYADRSPTFLQWAMEQCVKTAVKTALQNEIEKHRDMLVAALQKEMEKKNSPIIKQLVQGMANGFVEAAKSPYRLNIEIKESKS